MTAAGRYSLPATWRERHLEVGRRRQLPLGFGHEPADFHVYFECAATAADSPQAGDVRASRRQTLNVLQKRLDTAIASAWSERSTLVRAHRVLELPPRSPGCRDSTSRRLRSRLFECAAPNAKLLGQLIELRVRHARPLGVQWAH
jgi:hypothetical protein